MVEKIKYNLGLESLEGNIYKLLIDENDPSLYVKF